VLSELNYGAVSFVTFLSTEADWAVTDRLEFGVQMTHGPFDTGLMVETGVNGVTVFANVALLACAVKERLIVLEIFADALLTWLLGTACVEFAVGTGVAVGAHASGYVFVDRIENTFGLVFAWIGVAAVFEFVFEQKSVRNKCTECAQHN